jgi:hypothetical protein
VCESDRHGHTDRAQGLHRSGLERGRAYKSLPSDKQLSKFSIYNLASLAFLDGGWDLMGKTVSRTRLRVFTVGHSNRSFEEFLALLKEFEIGAVADIRRYPSSRKFPHFNRETLRKLLSAQGIGYVWLESLGGRRHEGKSEDSPNIGLESPGFRNYADYMATGEFGAAVSELLATAATSRIAIMCAEKFYWKCHRRLLSDYLFSKGVEVVHIVEPGKTCAHKLTPGAVVACGSVAVTYPPAGK